VGSADLTYGAEIGKLLDAQIAAAGGRFRGIRLITKWDADEQLNNGRYLIPPKLMSDPDFRKGFAELGPRNLSFDAMIYHPQIPELIDLARTYPDTTIILNHIGGLLAKTRTYLANEKEATDTWRMLLGELAKYPNVYVKLGGLGMPYLGFGFESLSKHAESCIEAFGAQRCMFESNFPPDRASVDYHVIWNAFKRVAAKYSAADKQALFFGTAAKAYQLKID
jgi:predicted TIM-barrel fold metal-dependent hydrolase